MLTIREEQLRAFQLAALDRLTERMCEHVTDCFPSDCKLLGPQQVRQLVRHGILRARKWGFTRERDLAGFVDMLFLLSPSFDRDPRLPWIRTILRSNVEPPVRMDRLWIGTTRLLQKLSKPRDERP